MALDNKKFMLIGKLLGGILLVAAGVGVFFIKWQPEIPTVEDPIRPVKSQVLGVGEILYDRTYPGRVRANQEVQLAFEVSGVITNLFVKASSMVTNGQILAALDDRDFMDAMNAAKAELARARVHLERIRSAAEKNAVSQQELSDAEAAHNVAVSQLNIRTKALQDTRLRARFDGVISSRFVENFQGIQAKDPIFGLQSTNIIEVEVFLPESRIAEVTRDHQERDYSGQFVAGFDFFPDERFDLLPKEFTTEADPETQTFKATFIMPNLPDRLILPGMTVTVYEKSSGGDSSYEIPLDAVPVDGLGQYFVWVLNDDSSGYHKVERLNVETGRIVENKVTVVEGIDKDGKKVELTGKRIALAGTGVLSEGQMVRLLESTSK